MKTIITSIVSFCLLCLCVGIKSQTKIAVDENFSAGIPSEWVTSGTVTKTTNNSKTCVSMSSNASLTTSNIEQPVTLTFSHRASGNGKTLTVEKSINEGSWTPIGTASPSSSSGFGSASVSIGEKGTKNVRIRFTCGSSTIYLTDIKIMASEIGDAPTQQAGIIFGTPTGSSVQVNLTKGNGSGRLLVYKKGTAVDFIPEAGISYEPGTVSANGNTIAAGGDISSENIQGLEAGETYYFAVFEYNGFEETANYLTPGASGNIRTMEIPSAILSTYSINFGRLKIGTEDKREFTVKGKYLNPASGNVTITGNVDFQVSTDNLTYASSAIIPYTGSSLSDTKVYIKFSPTQLQDYSSEITVTGGGSETQSLTVNGSGSNTDTKIYYLSPNGKDTGAGSYDSPWYTLGRAIESLNPGDIVYVRGGEYKYPGTTFKITRSGTAEKRICVFAYENEQPIFNFDQAQGTSEGDSRLRGIVHQGDYWYFYGIHLTKARDNGVKLEGNNNIYERCTFSYCGDTGIQLGFGHNFQDSHPGISKNDGSYCCNNYIIDCDSYRNYDWQTKGGNADGFACKMHNGKDNWFIRCRAWENSDDGWDLYETDYPVYLIDCWAWRSARDGDHPANQGNGNGIKLGGNGSGGSSVGIHEAWNCIAFNCNKTGSVKGFDQNSHKGGVKVVNSLAFNNGYDFMFETSSPMEFYNNVCFGKQEIAGGTESNNALGTASSKGWATAMTGIGSADYVDLSEEAAKAPRGTNGSLPTGFARLQPGSKMIGAAKTGLTAPLPNIGTDLFGSALIPRKASSDLGPIDTSISTSTPQLIINPETVLSLDIYPNPVLSDATIKFAVNQDTDISLSVYDMQGRKVIDAGLQKALQGIDYYIPVNTNKLSSGIYIVTLKAGNIDKQCKLVKIF